MSMLTICEWLESTQLSTGIRESLLFYPMLHWSHILSNSLMFGTIAYLDLRLLGMGLRRRSVRDLAGQLLPWTWAGWVLMFISGMLILISDPVRYYNSVFFRFKMLLMLIAGANALIFHYTLYRKGIFENAAAPVPRRARLAGAVSLMAWIGIIVTGRAVGYYN
jgi:hypothetical protein